jgi:uncharacterized protein YgiB involved in biofilm formation
MGAHATEKVTQNRLTYTSFHAFALQETKSPRSAQKPVDTTVASICRNRRLKSHAPEQLADEHFKLSWIHAAQVLGRSSSFLPVVEGFLLSLAMLHGAKFTRAFFIRAFGLASYNALGTPIGVQARSLGSMIAWLETPDGFMGGPTQQSNHDYDEQDPQASDAKVNEPAHQANQGEPKTS